MLKALELYQNDQQYNSGNIVWRVSKQDLTNGFRCSVVWMVNVVTTIQRTTTELKGWAGAGLERRVGRVFPCSWLTSAVRSPHSQSNFHPRFGVGPSLQTCSTLNSKGFSSSPEGRALYFRSLFRNKGKLTASRALPLLQLPLYYAYSLNSRHW